MRDYTSYWDADQKGVEYGSADCRLLSLTPHRQDADIRILIVRPLACYHQHQQILVHHVAPLID